MTTIITITGASDDLVEIEGCKGADEFSYPSEGPWRGDLISPDGGQLRIHVFMSSDDSCWHVAFGQVDEGIPMPDWPIAWKNTPKLYAAEAIVTAPDGTRITNIGKAQIQ